VALRAGEFPVESAGLVMSERKLLGDLVEHWTRHASGRRTVVFACHVAHSEAITAAFLAAGIPAEHLDGSTATDRRDATLARLRAGETLVVSQCQILTEGWDLPELGCVVMARPTASLALYMQMSGRVMRPPGPAVVLDHAGNFHRHGPVYQDIPYSLEGRPRLPRLLGTRTCPECYAVFAAGAARTCPACGATPAAGTLGGIEDIRTVPGELVPAVPYEERRAWWYRHRDAAGYAALFGAPPPLVGPGWLVDVSSRDQGYRRSVWRALLMHYAEKTETHGNAVRDYRSVFGCLPVWHTRKLHLLRTGAMR
jgi:hypothetical protein